MKFTEGLFRDTGYQLAKDEFGAKRLMVVHGAALQIQKLERK